MPVNGILKHTYDKISRSLRLYSHMLYGKFNKSTILVRIAKQKVDVRHFPFPAVRLNVTSSSNVFNYSQNHFRINLTNFDSPQVKKLNFRLSEKLFSLIIYKSVYTHTHTCFLFYSKFNNNLT